MASKEHSEVSKRKKDHIDICLNENVAFKRKTNGLENYEFRHYAITEVDINKIDLSTNFFNSKINYPFLISCMTGGTVEAININKELAIAANELNIPIGVGSQRQVLENDDHNNSFKIVRENAPSVPVLSNIGAAQIASLENIDPIKKIVDLIKADALTIHINPLQELIQQNGQPNFKGFLNKLEKVVKEINIPVIVKEVGSGIDGITAKILLNTGVKGIDVSGAGGTSWAAVELIRNREKESEFWDWGLPTSLCIKEVNKLKNNYNFILIASGGISNGIEIAKALALGADICASARSLLKIVVENSREELINLIMSWFDDVKKIMYLTGTSKLKELTNNKLIKKEDLY